MEKTKKRIKLIALLLVLVAATCCFTGYTLAKYTSTATINMGSATVAKWSFTVGDTEIAKSEAQTITVNLFETINDTGNTAAETDVATGKIAPGTSGKFDLVVKNTSEVTANYKINFTATGAEAPITFTYKIGTTTLEQGTDRALAIGATETITVTWEWPFDGDDTALGIAAQNGTTAVTVTATLVATQKD